MNPYFLFSALNLIALICWLPLFLMPHHKFTLKYVQNFYVPIFFAIVYGFCLTNLFISTDLDFSTNALEGIKKIFDGKWGFITGWVHYLCFDFVVGSYIVIGAKKIDMKKPLLTICLILTFLIGPMGFLIYRTIKIAQIRN
jgi:hypothetical protein